jgi:hypothetical protein
MGRTRQKLDEAAFFLEKVREHYFDVLDENGQARAFLYYLSAFVSAARSVTWVMRSEYSTSQGWEPWYRSRQPDLEDRALLRQFATLRNRSEKADPLRIGIRLHLSLSPESPPRQGEPLALRHPTLQQYRVTITEVDPPSGEPRPLEASIDTLECALPELGDDDVLRCCSRYFDLLRRLVEDCESRFSTPV